MVAISKGSLTKGQIVYYTYENYDAEPWGPFRVKTLFSDHEGRKAILTGADNEDRIVSFADDDDFGSIIFHRAPI